jgi:type I site-specific restriction-modification system R (restriction) subunit
MKEASDASKSLSSFRYAERLEYRPRQYCVNFHSQRRVLLLAVDRKHARDLDAATKAGKEMGLTDDEKAFYDALAANDSAVTAMGDEKLNVIAAELIAQVKKSVTIDWNLRESARAKIKVMVKRILKKYSYPPDLQEEAVKTVLAQAELLCADWVVAGF